MQSSRDDKSWKNGLTGEKAMWELKSAGIRIFKLRNPLEMQARDGNALISRDKGNVQHPVRKPRRDVAEHNAQNPRKKRKRTKTRWIKPLEFQRAPLVQYAVLRTPREADMGSISMSGDFHRVIPPSACCFFRCDLHAHCNCKCTTSSDCQCTMRAVSGESICGRAPSML